MDTDEKRPPLRVASIALSAPSPGTAAAVHLEAIAAAWESAGHTVERLWPSRNHGSRTLQVLIAQLVLIPRLRRYDVLYVRWHVAGLLLSICARLSGVRTVLEVNGTHDDLLIAHRRLSFLERPLLLATRLEFRLATALVAVTPGLERWILELAPGSRTMWRPNGAEGALRHRSRTAQAPPYAVFIGEFARWQGLSTLLGARTSPAWPSDLGLVLIGSGADEGLVEEAADRGLVTYHGRLPREEALPILAGASMSISPQTGSIRRNKYGVTPLKVAESLMLGVPVVASDLPGQREILVSSPVSRLFEADDALGLARAAADLSRVDVDREAISAYAQEHLAWESVGKDIVAACEHWHSRGR